jgi:phospholipid/cholesterol/gamma-HCH transport system substrate-binding protein
MRSTTKAVAGLAAVVLGCSSCGISLQSLPKIGGVSGPTYTLTATFANVVNLPANAAVRSGAVTVGYVSAIGVKDFQAQVTMKIKKSTKLPVGTSADIDFDTPLGEDFVSLQPPAAAAPNGPVLTDGENLPEDKNLTAPSVEDAFGALGAVLNGGGINQLQTIITQTNLALDNNQGPIRALIQNLSATVTSFAQNTPSIDGALNAMAQLSTVLNRGSNTISNGIATLGPAVAVLADENHDLGALLNQLNQLSSVSNSIITASSAGTVSTLHALQPLLTQLVSVQQQLGPALTAIDGLEKNTPKVAPGDYLQLSINATVQVPPVPSDALPLHKVTVDPPESTESYDRSGIATLIEGGLP